MTRPFLEAYRRSTAALTLAALAALLSSACATPPPEPAPAPEPEPIVVAPSVDAPAAETPPSPPPPDPVDLAAEETVAAATAHFENGEFRKAIELLAKDPNVARASTPIRVRAGKTVAFARCTLGRKLECQRDFGKILALDPTFELSPFEAGNPNWEPALAAARKALQRRKGE